MEHTARIAAVGPLPDPLLGDLRALPLRPFIESFASLYASPDNLIRFQPDLLVTAPVGDATEATGALRFLRCLWPGLGVVLVVDASDELNRGPLAIRLGAQLLVHPCRPGQLAAAVEQALQGSQRPRADVFHELAHGIADEINNPLLFVSGHLQLLRAGFEPAGERNHRAEIDAAIAGTKRIQAAVDRLRLISDAADGPRRPEPVDLVPLLATAAEARRPANTSMVSFPNEACIVAGDREQLGAAIDAVLRIRDEMVDMGSRANVSLEALGEAARLRLVATADGLAAWSLPHSFEPYYANRLLRSHAHGLSLFLVQTVVHGHRGQATARRLTDGSLQFDFVLPRRAGTPPV